MPPSPPRSADAPDAPRPRQVEALGREPLHEGYCTIARWHLRHEQFAGGMGPPLTREVIERGHAVAILPYDPHQDRVVLIEQFRPGPWIAGEDPWMLEVVAGIVEDGETPEAVARRECVEECGLAPDLLEPACRYFVSPGVLTETVALYVGRVDAATAGGLFGLDHEGEDIRALTLPAEAFIALARGGGLTNATALIAGQWFALAHPVLRARWLAD